MVRLKYSVCVLPAMLSNFSFGQSDKGQRLPLKFVKGYGPFQVDRISILFSPPPSTHPLYQSWTSLQFNNVPSSFKTVEKRII
ncbi:MAG: hypothetical protein EOO10_14435 [Chitinophagaceae bacterium]|nr:MAG: hypothetical protein EOO10_14435 [Chitinophagaceae bacterium]